LQQGRHQRPGPGRQRDPLTLPGPRRAGGLAGLLDMSQERLLLVGVQGGQAEDAAAGQARLPGQGQGAGPGAAAGHDPGAGPREAAFGADGLLVDAVLRAEAFGSLRVPAGAVFEVGACPLAFLLEVTLATEVALGRRRYVAPAELQVDDVPLDRRAVGEIHL